MVRSSRRACRGTGRWRGGTLVMVAGPAGLRWSGSAIAVGRVRGRVGCPLAGWAGDRAAWFRARTGRGNVYQHPDRRFFRRAGAPEVMIHGRGPAARAPFRIGFWGPRRGPVDRASSTLKLEMGWPGKFGARTGRFAPRGSATRADFSPSLGAANSHLNLTHLMPFLLGTSGSCSAEPAPGRAEKKPGGRV